MQSLYNDCAVTVQSVIVQSLYSHCAVIIQSLFSHCSVTVQSLYSHYTVTVRGHCTMSITVPVAFSDHFKKERATSLPTRNAVYMVTSHRNQSQLHRRYNTCVHARMLARTHVHGSVGQVQAGSGGWGFAAEHGPADRHPVHLPRTTDR